MPFPTLGHPLPRGVDAHASPEKWAGWILASHGHGPEWRDVFALTAHDAQRLWTAILSAVPDAPVSSVRDRGIEGVVCAVHLRLTINQRARPWQRSGTTPTQTQHRGWSPPIPRPNMRPMRAVREITAFDLVELLEPVSDAPVGARGGVLEVRPDDTAMIEITAPELDPTERIIFAPLTKLRRVA